MNPLRSLVVLLAMSVLAGVASGAAAAPVAARLVPVAPKRFTIVYPADRWRPARTEEREAYVGDPISTAPAGEGVLAGTQVGLSAPTADYVYQGEDRLVVVREEEVPIVDGPEPVLRKVIGKVKVTRVNGKVTGLDLAELDMTVELALAAIKTHRDALQFVAFWLKVDGDNAAIVKALTALPARALLLRVRPTMYMREPDNQPESRWRMNLRLLAPLAGKLVSLVVADQRDVGIATLGRLRVLRCLTYLGDDLRAALRAAATLPELRILALHGSFRDADLAAFGRMGKLRQLDLAVSGSGRGMSALARLRQLEVLSLRLFGQADAGLVHLQGLPLRRLLVAGGAVTDAGLAVLARVPTLVALRLEGVSASRFEVLLRLPALAELEIERARISSEGLAHIGATTALVRLVLDRATFDEAALAALGKLASLRLLRIRWSALTAAALPHLGRIHSLRHLDLFWNRIADAGLAHLARLTALESLDLQGSPLTDAALGHLAPLRALRRLLLPETVTPAARQAFRRSHPGCQVP